MADDDDQAFRDAMRDVRPLPRRAARPSAPRPRAVARFARAEESAVLRDSLAAPDDASMLESGQQAAQDALREFVAGSVTMGLRCVRVIHGKGRRSGSRGPVIKRLVDHLLRRIEAVVAFVSARPIDGGTGAVYVLLARQTGRRV